MTAMILHVFSSSKLLSLGLYHIVSVTLNFLTSPQSYSARPYHPFSSSSSHQLHLPHHKHHPRICRHPPNLPATKCSSFISSNMMSPFSFTSHPCQTSPLLSTSTQIYFHRVLLCSYPPHTYA
ncbi:DUF716 domain-containing protein [Cucumis melo var. makuwa]|uniref:DUF716 domain-containing protein n=1 Tax=Cucumis melo var. makuwa TaxID=1194695 RepID=A0A5A7VHF6_CUCMM|nr:DUF716 domain-containing protein [Cucumis melo var. makuwa]